MFKIFIGFKYKEYAEGWFVRWQGGIAFFTIDPTKYIGGTEYTSVECLREYQKLIDHYQPLKENGTITNLKIEIHTDPGTTITLEELKEQVINDIKSLGAKTSFDPRPLTDNEKLAMFYMARYVSMQEQSSDDTTIKFRKFVEQYLPTSMQNTLDDIMKAFTTLGLEILGNDKDTLVDDEPYIDVEVINGGI